MILQLEMRYSMIQIAGIPFQQNEEWPSGSIENKIIQQMHNDKLVYLYQSIEELSFELKLRKSIMASARAMNQGDAQFDTLANSLSNPQYWILTKAGGFQLRPDKSPSDAIQDIFENSSHYTFECATAIIIIYYHAILNSIDKNVFDQLFQNIYLYSWHADPDLSLQSIRTNHFIPGDVVYFNNPDFNPETSWWRGENAIVLEDGTYFGHELGIMTAEQIIEELNKWRMPGSNQSAYLTNKVLRPSFNHLAAITMFPRGYTTYKTQHFAIHHKESSISYDRYLFYLHTTFINPFL